MAKVKALHTIRYGTNGFKHPGDVFNLPDELAKEKELKGLVEIQTKEEKTTYKTK